MPRSSGRRSRDCITTHATRLEHRPVASRAATQTTRGSWTILLEETLVHPLTDFLRLGLDKIWII